MTSPRATFSIVIPTRNRPETLASCLRALTHLDYPRECFEVIVVDDGSSTDLAEVVRPLTNRLDLKLERQAHSGPATARNTGASHATGRFLAFTDDDCQPAADWLDRFATHLESDPGRMIGGLTINELTDNPYSCAAQVLIDYIYEYFNTNNERAQFFTSNNMALSLSTFREIGGFETSFPLPAAEDRELCDRWSDLGHRMTYEPKAIIHHRHDMTLRRFLRQQYNYGRGACHFHRIRSLRDLAPIRIEPVSFYINLLRYPFGRRGLRFRLRIATLLLLSQLANAAGYFREKVHSGPKETRSQSKP